MGLWVDQRRHRPVLIWTNLVRAALVGAVPLPRQPAGLLHVGALYVVAFGVGVCWVLFDVCWLSYVPSVVTDRRQLVEANGKLGVSFSAAQVSQAGLADVLVQFLTAPYALAVDAASYLVSAASLSAIRRPERHRPRGTARPPGPSWRRCAGCSAIPPAGGGGSSAPSTASSPSGSSRCSSSSPSTRST